MFASRIIWEADHHRETSVADVKFREGLQGGQATSSIQTWHESQIDELFASILGKGFNTSNGNNVGTDTGEQSMDSHLEKALQGGFRVFG